VFTVQSNTVTKEIADFAHIRYHTKVSSASLPFILMRQKKNRSNYFSVQSFQSAWMLTVNIHLCRQDKTPFMLSA